MTHAISGKRVAMDDFSPTQFLPHDARYCRTHAFAASLFAAYPRHRSNAKTWVYVASAWSDLAELKDRAGRAPITRNRKPQ